MAQCQSAQRGKKNQTITKSHSWDKNWKNNQEITRLARVSGAVLEDSILRLEYTDNSRTTVTVCCSRYLPVCVDMHIEWRECVCVRERDTRVRSRVRSGQHQTPPQLINAWTEVTWSQCERHQHQTPPPQPRSQPSPHWSTGRAVKSNHRPHTFDVHWTRTVMWLLDVKMHHKYDTNEGQRHQFKQKMNPASM